MRALQWYQERGYQKETMQGLLLLSRIEREKGDYPSALASLKQQLDLATQQRNPAQIALSQEGIGNVRLAQGLWSEALKSYRAELDAAAQSGVTLYAQVAMVNCADVLWRLGRYREVQPLLDQVGPHRSKDVDALIARLQAESSLSRREFTKAQEAASRVLSADLGREDLRAEWTGILALAEAWSGNSAEAVRHGELARELAGHTGNPRLAAEAELAQGEAALVAREYPRALEDAKLAAAWTASAGDPEMEWRCWWLSARATEGSGRKDEARDFAQKSSNLLAGLAQKWDPEDFRTYLTRPDVEFAKHQVTRMGSQ
jgi:tetratricopeptide (TPR) repeat protein